MISIMIDDDLIQLNSVELSSGLLTVWLNSASGIRNLAQMRAKKTNNDNDGGDDDNDDNNNNNVSSRRHCKQRTQKQMFCYNTTVSFQSSFS